MINTNWFDGPAALFPFRLCQLDDVVTDQLRSAKKLELVEILKGRHASVLDQFTFGSSRCLRLRTRPQRSIITIASFDQWSGTI